MCIFPARAAGDWPGSTTNRTCFMQNHTEHVCCLHERGPVAPMCPTQQMKTASPRPREWQSASKHFPGCLPHVAAKDTPGWTKGVLPCSFLEARKCLDFHVSISSRMTHDNWFISWNPQRLVLLERDEASCMTQTFEVKWV